MASPAEQTKATTKTGTAATAPTSDRSGATNRRLAHIRANYPRPQMFIKNGKLVLGNKK